MNHCVIKFILIFLLSISISLYSQPFPEINKIFLGLPLDSSRNIVCKIIRANKIFTEVFLKEISSDSTQYIGRISDISHPSNEPDSVMIFVESYPGHCKKYRKNRKDTIDKNRFTISYYYSSGEVKSFEYENYLSRLRMLAKDSVDIESEGEYIVAGKCYFLKKGRNLPQIQIEWYDAWKGGYDLSVTYIRE